VFYTSSRAVIIDVNFEVLQPRWIMISRAFVALFRLFSFQTVVVLQT